MSDSTASLVVVTGANGLVGSRVCVVLSERGVRVRALVRRPGTAPDLPGVEEHVGDFASSSDAATALAGATAAVTTVHPMGSGYDAQHEVGVEGTATFARAAVQAGVGTLVHVSTAGVYDRSPGTGDVDESGPLLGEDAGAYPVTKRAADEALAGIEGFTRFLVRPPAILGPGESSIWNTLRPASLRDDPASRRTNPDGTFAWIHVDDLAALIADLATGALTGAPTSGCTPVNAAAEPATQRDYVGTVLAALDLEPAWTDEPAWTGRIVADRARSWGWAPRVHLDAALAELASGLRP